MTIKMMGVIYRAFKEGQLEGIDNDDINQAYAYVKKLTFNYDFSRRPEICIITSTLKEAVEAVFANNYKKVSEKMFNFKNVELI